MCFKTLGLMSVLALAIPAAYSQTTITDPATLHIGFGVDTTCSTCTHDPNQFGTATNTLDIYQNDNGANTIGSGSLLLVLAVPNTVTFTAPTSVTETDYDSSGTLIAEPNPQATLQSTTGTLTAASGSNADVYSALGLPEVSPHSDNFANLTGASGIPTVDSSATSFSIYEYLVTGSELVANGYAQFQFGSNLPGGIYAFGYGCEGTGGFPTNCTTDNPNPYDTPFTEAGLTDGPGVPSVPEPTSIVLFGTVMIGAGFVYRRSKLSLRK